MIEQWRPVVGFEGRYEVSNLGRVASLPNRQRPTRIIMRQSRTPDGYYRLNLCADGTRVRRSVHLLVAAAFIGPRPEGLMTRHMDGDPGNNRAGNLAWGTAEENAQDMLRHGRGRNQRKTECKRGHKFDQSNTYVWTNGSRRCRRCDALAHRKTERTP